MKTPTLFLLACSSFALTGCVASMAMSAVGAAVQAASADSDTGPIYDMRAQAREACRARAATLGTPHIIDAEQDRRRVTVWGTVQEPQQRRSFVCTYDGGRNQVRGFRLRDIPAAGS